MQHWIKHYNHLVKLFYKWIFYSKICFELIYNFTQEGNKYKRRIVGKSLHQWIRRATNKIIRNIVFEVVTFESVYKLHSLQHSICYQQTPFLYTENRIVFHKCRCLYFLKKYNFNRIDNELNREKLKLYQPHCG